MPIIFYRLIQRAERVTLLYNTATEGINRGEWSRFMLQFLIEWGYEIKHYSLEASQSPQGTVPITIEKTPDIMRRMQNRFDVRVNQRAILSPSALNCYMDCSLKFYYKYVASLSAPDEVSAEIDSAKFGSIFHYAAEHIYNDLSIHNKVINKEAIETLLKDEIKLKDYVDCGFKKLFFNIPENERPEYNGIQLINSEVIVRYIRQLLENDLRYAPFTFVASEWPVEEAIDIQTPKGVLKLRMEVPLIAWIAKMASCALSIIKPEVMPTLLLILRVCLFPTRNVPVTYSRPFFMLLLFAVNFENGVMTAG